MDDNKNIGKTIKPNDSIQYQPSDYRMFVEEQPFYRKGMSSAEAQRELEYLNKNIQAFYEGEYVPLWKQRWYL